MLTFDQVIVLYLQELKRQGKDISRDLESAKSLRPLFTGKTVEEITPALVQQYTQQRRSQQIAGSTINRETGLITRAWNWTSRIYQLNLKTPVIYKQTEPEPPMVFLTKAEAKRLIAQAQANRSDYLADFIVLCLYTGARMGEALKLEWERVDLEQNLIYLHPKNQKNRKSGTLVLLEPARQALLNRQQFHAQHCPTMSFILIVVRLRR